MGAATHLKDVVVEHSVDGVAAYAAEILLRTERERERERERKREEESV